MKSNEISYEEAVQIAGGTEELYRIAKKHLDDKVAPALFTLAKLVIDLNKEGDLNENCRYCLFHGKFFISGYCDNGRDVDEVTVLLNRGETHLLEYHRTPSGVLYKPV